MAAEKCRMTKEDHRPFVQQMLKNLVDRHGYCEEDHLEKRRVVVSTQEEAES
jgi:hypothetical protein